MNERLIFWRRLALISYVLLILFIAYWFFMVSPSTNKAMVLFSLVYLLILFIPLPQLAANKPRVYMWSSYLILLYFMHAVVEAYANTEERGYALIELILTVVYFVSATFCYRYSRKKLKID